MDDIIRLRVFLTHRKTGKVIEVKRYIARRCCLDKTIYKTVIPQYIDEYDLTDIKLYKEVVYNCESFKDETSGKAFKLIKGGIDD